MQAYKYRVGPILATGWHYQLIIKKHQNFFMYLFIELFCKYKSWQNAV